MQINLNSDLITYSLEDGELEAGSALNYLQRALIQNLRVETATQLLSLSPSTMTEEGKETYWQQEAYLRGQLDILTNLLARSDAVSSSQSNSQES